MSRQLLALTPALLIAAGILGSSALARAVDPAAAGPELLAGPLLLAASVGLACLVGFRLGSLERGQVIGGLIIAAGILVGSGLMAFLGDAGELAGMLPVLGSAGIVPLLGSRGCCRARVES